jgi:transcriptional regulator with GAF, ATPase, and Fis domain
METGTLAQALPLRRTRRQSKGKAMNQQHSTDTRSGPSQRLDEPNAYAALSKIVFADQPLATVLERVANLAKQVLPESPEVSVTLIAGNRPRTAAFTGSLAVQLDERQYHDGFGPCLDAAVTGQTIKLTMDDPDSLYPDFCTTAQRQGVSHTISVGLPVATRSVGALNIYNSTGQPFSDDSDRIARTFASFAGIVLANVGLYHDAADLAAQLQAAMETRSVIEQAKGIIMADKHCSGDEAFKVLTRLSQNQNLKLRIVAQALVDSVTQPGAGPG